MFDKASELKPGRYLYKNWGALVFYCAPDIKRFTLEKLRDERLK